MSRARIGRIVRSALLGICIAVFVLISLSWATGEIPVATGESFLTDKWLVGVLIGLVAALAGLLINMHLREHANMRTEFNTKVGSVEKKVDLMLEQLIDLKLKFAEHNGKNHE